MNPRMHTSDDDADYQLAALGLSRAMLNEVGKRGLAEYLTATAFHPSNGAGLKLYLELVKSIREELIPGNRAWTMNEEGVALTCSEQIGIAIAVRSGDANVGDPKRIPSFKYPESDTMVQAISTNLVQTTFLDGRLGFEELEPKKRIATIDLAGLKTWWFLHFVDVGRSVMRSEFSLPIRVGAAGEMNEWADRIILDPISFDDGPKVARGDYESATRTESVVTIKRKAS